MRSQVVNPNLVAKLTHAIERADSHPHGGRGEVQKAIYRPVREFDWTLSEFYPLREMVDAAESAER